MKRRVLAAAMAAIMGIMGTGMTVYADGEEPLKVALVYSGFLGDKSFNDLAHEGAQKAIEDFGVEVQELESGEAADWEANFVAMADAGYDLVIGVSTPVSYTHLIFSRMRGSFLMAIAMLLNGPVGTRFTLSSEFITVSMIKSTACLGSSCFANGPNTGPSRPESPCTLSSVGREGRTIASASF